MTMDANKALGTLGRMFKKILRMTYKGLKVMFGDVLSNPIKFILLIVTVIIIVVLTYWQSIFLLLVPLVTFYFALWKGRGTYERRKKRKVGWIGTIVIIIISISIITPTTLGYIIFENSQMVTARVPPKDIEPKKSNGWTETDYGDIVLQDKNSALFVNIDHKDYEFKGNEKPPYPGGLIVVTVKSVPLTTSFPDAAIEQIGDTLEEYILELDEQSFEGLSIEPNSKVTGTRTIKDGHKTEWFEYSGKIDKVPSDALIQNFVKGGKIRIRGETWACSETGSVISVAGVAQYGYTFEPGTFQYGYALAQRDYPDDARTWVTLKNLINNVECT